MLVDIAEDEFTLPACISSDDDMVRLVKAGAYHLELLECCGVGYIVLILTYLADDKHERDWDGWAGSRLYKQ